MFDGEEPSQPAVVEEQVEVEILAVDDQPLLPVDEGEARAQLEDELLQLAPKIGVVIWIWIFATFLETVAIANQEARVATVFIVAASFSKTLLMGAAVFAFATVESFIYAAMIHSDVRV